MCLHTCWDPNSWKTRSPKNWANVLTQNGPQGPLEVRAWSTPKLLVLSELSEVFRKRIFCIQADHKGLPPSPHPILQFQWQQLRKKTLYSKVFLLNCTLDLWLYVKIVMEELTSHFHFNHTEWYIRAVLPSKIKFVDTPSNKLFPYNTYFDNFYYVLM